MALSNIQPNQPRPVNVQSRDNAQRTGPAKEGPRAEEALAGGGVEQVRLGAQVTKADADRILVESVLARIQPDMPSPAAQELFMAAGKAEFDAQAFGPQVDTSPEATAGRILDGITGYIFNAWQMQNPEATEADFLKFQDQVMSGFEKGLQDAKDILTGLQAMTPELETEIGRTEQIVRDGLDEFFQDTFEQIREAAQSQTEETGVAEV